jgi:HlyD family secretion protein
MRRLLTLLIVVGVAAGGILLLFPEWLRAPADPPYRTAKVDRGAVVATVSATGSINPTTTVIVGSQLSGLVVEILADYNSEVKAGQIVARLNSDQIRARLDAARADLAQMRAMRQVQEAQIERVHADIERLKAAEAEAQAQITRNEVLLADAERALGRQEELRRRGVTTEAALDSARTQRDAQRASLDSARATLASVKAQALGLAADLQVARAQLQAVSAQVLQREATVRQIEVDLGNTDIRSPVSGTVVQRNIELGATVAASLQAPTLFLIADDLRRMEISANIDETDVGRIRAGQRSTFTVNAYPGRTFEGEVKQVRLGSQTVQNVVIYTTIISVENPRQELLPGMTANLQVETDRRENVLRVPNAALRWRPPTATPDPPARTPGPGPGPAMAQEGQPARGGGGRGGGGGQALNAFADAVRSELDLSPEQRKEVDAAFDEMREAVRTSPAGARREAAQAARTQLVQRISAVLTPEQRTKFDALRARLADSRGQRGAVQYGRVYILGAGREPEAVAVRLGATDGAMTEVASERLADGIEVIVGGGPRQPEGANQGAQQQQQRRGPRFGF